MNSKDGNDIPPKTQLQRVIDEGFRKEDYLQGAPPHNVASLAIELWLKRREALKAERQALLRRRGR